MSTAAINTPVPEPAYSHLVKRTIEACAVAKDAAAAAAEELATKRAVLVAKRAAAMAAAVDRRLELAEAAAA